ncbi:SCAR-like protein 1 isoform X5 [Telopea speciosissima]|uniref:SCAR-like protein 1 isoform X5 n=1 Tax=Telopea speciosissima TaxID=54955 RepID=UPI001CC6EE00|nr:SCAR-like protein 1 isoform X5 [Telopea speciosissima]XP_043707096.1 SCAR-like protein 1 isoform X5 [Telopea speciosissima]
MPLTRYQIRNEYNLADPELYRAADKDDPEAILEGVALAGLVGVLRQLGDLAEFAAQIFHDLHEEVMATAARGHGLMLRVQQLEAEVPSIEKAFLTQTSHSLFLLNAGVDWHPNLRMDENLITREDLPRCVMDSYEECRGPPRLFLLDKFDVAGAGACLKRYSDPSFFKAEFTSSETMGADIQREKKARKVKKKGSRWRNGENTEVYPTSHAKLHQLLSKERNSDNNALMQHVKLKKRQLNGFLSDSTTGKSYMERFVETNSPEKNISCENSLALPPLNMESSNTCELGLEICEISTASPASNFMQRKRGLHSSAERQETALEQSMYDLHEDVMKEGILEKLHEPMCDIEVEKLPSSLYKLEDQKELVVDVEIQKETSVDGYQSDDITSEVDNYMDALPTMESEMETDTDIRPNNDQGFFNMKRHGMDSDTKEEQQKHQDQFSDSHSIGNSIESDEYNLCKKGRYGPPGRDVVAEVVTSAGTCPTEIVDASSEKPSANDNTLVTESLEYAVPSGSCIEVSEIPSSGSEAVEASPDSCVTDSTSTASYHLIRGANLNEFQLQGPDFVGYRDPSSNTEEDTENLVGDVPCTTNLSDFASKTKDDTLAEEFGKSQLVEVMDGLTREVSSDASLHRSDISGLVVARKYDGGTLDTVFPTKCAEVAPTDNINRNNDLPHSIILATDEQLSCLERLDVEVCSSTKLPECLQASTNTDDLDDLKSDRSLETDTGIQTREKPEYVASALDIQKTGNHLSEMTEEVPPQMDLEVGSGSSGVNTLYNNLEVSSNTPDGGVSDEPTLDVVQSNSGGSVGKDASSSPEFPSLYLTPDSPKTASVTDYSLQMDSLSDTINAEADADSVMYRKLIGSWNYIKQQEECPLGSRDGGGLLSEIYAQLDNMESVRVHAEAGDEDTAVCELLVGSPSRNHVKLEDKCPASNGNVCDIENEVHSKLDNLTTDIAHTEADDADAADCPNRIGSSSKIQMKLHEECLRDAGSEQCKLETAEACNPKFLIGEDAQKEKNQLVATSTNLDVQVYNSESHSPSSSEFPYDVHVSLPVQHPQGHLHLMDITEVPKSSVEMDKQLQFAHQIQPSESAEGPVCTSLSNQELRIPSEQALVVESRQLIMESLDGQAEYPKGRDQNCFPSFPYEISWFEKTEPVKQTDPDGSSVGASEICCIDPLKQPLDFPSVPTSHNMLTCEPTIVPLASSFPSFDMSGTGHEQSSKQQPSQGLNVAQANLEAPPLPPLPPLQWRVGKLQHSSLTAEGGMVQPSLNPFLPLGFTPLGGEIVQPLNPFLPLNSRGEGKSQHGSKASWEDILHLDLNPFSSQLPSVVADANNIEGSQTSEVQEIQHPNPFLPLPATEDEKHEHDSLPLGEEKAKPSLNSFAPSPTTEEVRPPSDTSQGESCDLPNLSEPESNMNDGTIKDEPLNSLHHQS